MSSLVMSPEGIPTLAEQALMHRVAGGGVIASDKEPLGAKLRLSPRGKSVGGRQHDSCVLRYI